MRVASDVEKRREIGQFGIFSPLLYQLSYPAEGDKPSRTDVTPQSRGWQASLRWLKAGELTQTDVVRSTTRERAAGNETRSPLHKGLGEVKLALTAMSGSAALSACRNLSPAGDS
jgi:hypothetical protein